MYNDFGDSIARADRNMELLYRELLHQKIKVLYVKSASYDCDAEIMLDFPNLSKKVGIQVCQDGQYMTFICDDKGILFGDIREKQSMVLTDIKQIIERLSK